MNVYTIGDTPNIAVRFLDKDTKNIVDIGAASTLSLLLIPPSGPVLVRSATLLTDGSDGIAYYTLLTSDITIAGKWSYKGKLTLNGMVLTSTPSYFLSE